MALIEVKDIQYSYLDGTQALNSVSLAIEAGELVTIVGQNGSGKTTLAKHLNGLLKPNTGEVVIAGNSTKEHSVAQMSQKVGYLFQNPNHQIFSNTVYTEIAFGLTRQGQDPELVQQKVEEVMGLLGIDYLRDKHPMFINLAEKQLVAIASYLTMDPSVFVMDEPTSSLDHHETEKIRDIIRILREKGHTIIVITHDMKFVADHPQRVVVMSQGQIIFDGPGSKLFCSPSILEQAHLAAPQIKQMNLDFAQIPPDIFSVEEMVSYIMSRRKV